MPAGDLLHIDTKKIGRIERPSHRVTGNRRDSVEGAGWEMLFVAVDDHARIAFTAMHADEKTPQAVQVLRDAFAHYAGLGITVRRVLIDNGSAFRSRDFAGACAELGITHNFTRAYRPQTNGKAARFIQSALREWACGWTYQNSAQRARALASWQHHYNCHRPHAGIGGAFPMSRLNSSRHNLLTVHRFARSRSSPDDLKSLCAMRAPPRRAGASPSQHARIDPEPMRGSLALDWCRGRAAR